MIRVKIDFPDGVSTVFCVSQIVDNPQSGTLFLYLSNPTNGAGYRIIETEPIPDPTRRKRIMDNTLSAGCLDLTAWNVRPLNTYS